MAILYDFFVHSYINIFEAVIFVLFVHTIFNLRFKIKLAILFSISTGVVNTHLDYLSRYFGSLEYMLKPLLYILAIILMCRCILKLSYSKSIISCIAFLIFTAFCDTINYFLLSKMGLTVLDIIDIKYYQIIGISYLIVCAFFVLVVRVFKLFTIFPQEFKIKTFILSFGHVLFLLPILITNINYYIKNAGSITNYWVTQVNILVLCYLIYSFVSMNNNIYELSQKNTEISFMNEKLKEHVAIVEELTIVKERNRVARDIHDTLGHTMTLLVTMLEVSNINFEKDPAESREGINKSIKIAQDGLKELRRSISGLSLQPPESINLISSLETLVSNFHHSGVNIDFSVEGTYDCLNREYSDVIYRICQEALTNSLRHGKAKNVTVILKIIDGWIKLYIFDDGQGCKEIKKGHGLSGMEHRINNLNGELSFGSDGERGFNINVKIPVKVSSLSDIGGSVMQNDSSSNS